MNATLLELTPARPLVVRVDGRIEADAQLVRELGLKSHPSRLAELAGNDSADFPRRSQRTDRGGRGGARFRRPNLAQGAGERCWPGGRGGPAPAPEPGGAQCCSGFSIPAPARRSARSSPRGCARPRVRPTLSTSLSRRRRSRCAVPRPDLKLGLVNSAFVDVVEGEDAADVIERGA